MLLISLETVDRLDANRLRAALLDVLDRVGDVQDVLAVSAAEYNPIGRAWTHYVRLPGTTYETLEVTMAPVTHGFFETMRIPLLAGRAFTREDLDPSRPGTIVVSESFARRYYANQSAVGQTFEGAFFEGDERSRMEVIGVVADTKYDLRQPAAPILYLPMPFRSAGTLHLRVAGTPKTLVPKLVEEVRAASPLFRVTSALPQSTVIERTMLRERLLALLSAFFAVVGVVLAAVGLFGVLSFSVVQRTPEIGLRVALGSSRWGVIGTVLGDSGKDVIVGAFAGLAAGVYSARFVETLLFEVTPLDFLSLALPLTTLLGVALLAAAVPAWRAARVDPAIALRYE